MLIFIWCPFCPRVTTVAYKRPQSFGKKCTWQLHLNTHAPLTQQSQSGLTMPRSRHSVRTNQETNSHTTHQGILSQSFQLAEPLWTDPSLRSGISVHKLISTKKKAHTGNEFLNILKKSLHTRKKPPPPQICRFHLNDVQKQSPRHYRGPQAKRYHRPY